jgi:hypothetical protein
VDEPQNEKKSRRNEKHGNDQKSQAAMALAQAGSIGVLLTELLPTSTAPSTFTSKVKDKVGIVSLVVYCFIII